MNRIAHRRSPTADLAIGFAKGIAIVLLLVIALAMASALSLG